jgi:signal transduction histidine kinase
MPPPNPANPANLANPASEVPPAGEANTIDWIVNLTIAQATTRTERRFAWLRIAFCLTALAVFLLHLVRYPGDVHSSQVPVELSIMALGVVLSAWVLGHTRARLITDSVKLVAAAVDGLMVTVALGSNQLSPAGTYDGLLSSLDVAIAPLTILTSVLRVSPRAVATSSAVISIGVGALLAVDAARGLSVAPKLPLYAIYHLMAVLLAHYFTARAREIFGRVGQVAVRAEGARRSVRALLEDHHDLRSVLTNLQLGADRLHEALVNGEERSRVATLEASLGVGIAALTKGADTTRSRALQALEGADQPSRASVDEALRQATVDAEGVAPGLVIRFDAKPIATPVLFGGGTPALARLFLHLLVNAREGNGTTNASTVRLTTRARRGVVEIDVADDGPGFSPGLLEKLGQERGFTTKAGSSGIGLWLAHSSLLAAGGSLTLSNEDGARVRIVLRAAP